MHGMKNPPPAQSAVKPTPVPKAKPVKRATTAKSAKTAKAAPVRRAPRRWTPPEMMAPHILDVLGEAGGELEADTLFRLLEARLGEMLLDGDRELTPEGELRWRYAARRARHSLILEGQMASRQPGVWAIADD